MHDSESPPGVGFVISAADRMVIVGSAAASNESVGGCVPAPAVVAAACPHGPGRRSPPPARNRWPLVPIAPDPAPAPPPPASAADRPADRCRHTAIRRRSDRAARPVDAGRTPGALHPILLRCVGNVLAHYCLSLPPVHRRTRLRNPGHSPIRSRRVSLRRPRPCSADHGSVILVRFQDHLGSADPMRGMPATRERPLSSPG